MSSDLQWLTSLKGLRPLRVNGIQKVMSCDQLKRLIEIKGSQLKGVKQITTKGEWLMALKGLRKLRLRFNGPIAAPKS